MGRTKTTGPVAAGDVAAASPASSPRRRTKGTPKVAPNGHGGLAASPPQVIRSLAGTVIDPMSLLFDTDWYRAQYPDVAVAGLDPIRHFFDNGAREGRNPNANFETSWYLSTNADVAASMMNPFLHYLLYGAREGRRSKP